MSAQNSLTIDTTHRTRANNCLLNLTKSNAPTEGVSIFSAFTVSADIQDNTLILSTSFSLSNKDIY